MSGEIVLIRHAAYDESDPAVAADGRWDPDLSADGRLQAEALAARLSGHEFDRLCTSPLRRCRRTADIVATACGLAPHARDDLREYHMGELEHGWAVRRGDYDAAWAEGSWTAWPGGETREGFRTRIATLLADLSGQGARTLVVTHGGVVNELLSLALHGDVRGRFRIDLTGMSRLLVQAGTAVVSGVNDVWHLEDPLTLPLAGVRA